jgi:hypothetical protein
VHLNHLTAMMTMIPMLGRASGQSAQGVKLSHGQAKVSKTEFHLREGGRKWLLPYIQLSLSIISKPALVAHGHLPYARLNH